MGLATSQSIGVPSTLRSEETAPSRPARRKISDAPLPPVLPDDAILEMDVAPRRRESIYAVCCSLALHVLLIAGLAFVVFDEDDHSVGSLSGVLGTPEGDAPADFIIGPDEIINSGGSSDPIEFFSNTPSFSDLGAESNPNPSKSRGGIGSGEGDGEGDGVGIGVPAVGVPGHAVTKGSFSAWTIPEDPEPLERYVIMIQVKLPGEAAKLKKYRARDITGMVIGTDGYKQVIRFKTTDLIDIEDGVVQFQIPVPGAKQLVRDTIRIESKLLKEKQTIVLVF